MLMAGVMYARSTQTFFVISVEDIFVVSIESIETKELSFVKSVRKKESRQCTASEPAAIQSLQIHLLHRKGMKCNFFFFLSQYLL